MARIFVSFHHKLNQKHADLIRQIIKKYNHIDITLNEGNKIDNEESLTDEQIRQKIRDKFLKDVDVTIVIVGSDSKNRKHIDWEIRSTIHKFENHRDSGIVVINVIDTKYSWILDDELVKKYDATSINERSWPEKIDKKEIEWLPERLVNSMCTNYSYQDCLNKNYKHAVFPIIEYKKIKENNELLNLAIRQALNFKRINKGKWDTQTKMRRKNNDSGNRTTFKQVNP